MSSSGDLEVGRDSFEADFDGMTIGSGLREFSSSSGSKSSSYALQGKQKDSCIIEESTTGLTQFEPRRIKDF